MEELSGGNFFCFLSVYQICFLDLFVLLPFSADKREMLNKTVALPVEEKVVIMEEIMTNAEAKVKE